MRPSNLVPVIREAIIRSKNLPYKKLKVAFDKSVDGISEDLRISNYRRRRIYDPCICLVLKSIRNFSVGQTIVRTKEQKTTSRLMQHF